MSSNANFKLNSILEIRFAVLKKLNFTVPVSKKGYQKEALVQN